MKPSTDLTALQAHLNAIEAKTLAWVAEDPKNRWACYPTTDVAHWAEIGITTPEQYEHHNLVCNVYEGIREQDGYKPNWGSLNAMSDADLQKEMDYLSASAKREQERAAEHARQEQADALAHEAATQAALAHKSGFAIGEIIGAL